jgi:CheY-like chemotaxis protein
MARSALIVDDNPNMASLLSEMLELFDYSSERASDGDEALEKLEKSEYSIVISDMRMPNMTGLELLEHVKNKHPKMPVVIISGYAMKDETSPSGHKPDGFLSKPFLMSDIERLLNTLL